MNIWSELVIGFVFAGLIVWVHEWWRVTGIVGLFLVGCWAIGHVIHQAGIYYGVMR